MKVEDEVVMILWLFMVVMEVRGVSRVEEKVCCGG